MTENIISGYAPKLKKAEIVNAIYGWTPHSQIPTGVWTPGVTFKGGTLPGEGDGKEKELFINYSQGHLRQWRSEFYPHWVDLGPTNNNILLPYNIADPQTGSDCEFINNLTENTLKQWIDGNWRDMGSNNNGLPVGNAYIRFRDYDPDNTSGKEANLYLIISSDVIDEQRGYEPLLATDQGFVVKKDIAAGGFVSTNQGAVFIGHGLDTIDDIPKIVLMHSDPNFYPPNGYGTLYLRNRLFIGNHFDDTTPGNLDLGNLTVHGSIFLENAMLEALFNTSAFVSAFNARISSIVVGSALQFIDSILGINPSAVPSVGGLTVADGNSVKPSTDGHSTIGESTRMFQSMFTNDLVIGNYTAHATRYITLANVDSAGSDSGLILNFNTSSNHGAIVPDYENQTPNKTMNLGDAAHRWTNIYCSNLTAGNISGITNLTVPGALTLGSGSPAITFTTGITSGIRYLIPNGNDKTVALGSSDHYLKYVDSDYVRTDHLQHLDGTDWTFPWNGGPITNDITIGKTNPALRLEISSGGLTGMGLGFINFVDIYPAGGRTLQISGLLDNDGVYKLHTFSWNGYANNTMSLLTQNGDLSLAGGLSVTGTIGLTDNLSGNCYIQYGAGTGAIRIAKIDAGVLAFQQFNGSIWNLAVADVGGIFTSWITSTEGGGVIGILSPLSSGTYGTPIMIANGGIGGQLQIKNTNNNYSWSLTVGDSGAWGQQLAFLRGSDGTKMVSFDELGNIAAAGSLTLAGNLIGSGDKLELQAHGSIWANNDFIFLGGVEIRNAQPYLNWAPASGGNAWFTIGYSSANTNVYLNSRAAQGMALATAGNGNIVLGPSSLGGGTSGQVIIAGGHAVLPQSTNTGRVGDPPAIQTGRYFNWSAAYTVYAHQPGGFDAYDDLELVKQWGEPHPEVSEKYDKSKLLPPVDDVFAMLRGKDETGKFLQHDFFDLGSLVSFSLGCAKALVKRDEEKSNAMHAFYDSVEVHDAKIVELENKIAELQKQLNILNPKGVSG